MRQVPYLPIRRGAADSIVGKPACDVQQRDVLTETSEIRRVETIGLLVFSETQNAAHLSKFRVNKHPFFIISNLALVPKLTPRLPPPLLAVWGGGGGGA